MTDQVVSSAVGTTPADAPGRAIHPLGALAVAAGGGALFVDAAIETLISGSAVRWWVGGAAALYIAATAATWRTRIGWRGRFAAAALGMLGLVAVTAWGPGGLSDGIRIAGQSTTRVLGVLTAAGVALAGFVLARTPKLPLPARAGVGAVAAYGVFAFAFGAIASTPFATMLAGESLWRVLPTVLQGAFLGGVIILPAGLVWSIVRAGLRRPAETSLRSELWKGTAMAASLAIVVAGLPLRSSQPGSAAQAPAARPDSIAATLGIDPNAPKLTPAALNAALANSIRAIEDGERGIARDRWDPGYVAAALGSDPQRLFAFVQNNTFWIPYRGLLRGATGVLMDRQGNSLDRSVLLATLLRKANRTVRLAHGSLSEEQASELLRSLVLSRYASYAPAPAKQVEYRTSAALYQLDQTAVMSILTLQSDSRMRKQAELLARVPDQARRLAAAVGAPASDMARGALARAIDALRDHYWVQSLDGAGTWQDFDPLAPAGTALTNSTQTVSLDALPGDVRHQVTVRVLAEQWSHGALVEHTALERALIPADLIGAPVILQFVPEKPAMTFPPANMSPRQGLRAHALDQHEWTPTLVVGRTPFAQSTIRETGDLTRASPAAKSPAAGAMTGLAKRLEDALGPSGSPAPESKPDTSGVLTSTTIEYEIHAPGERPQKIRRTLFDLVGPAARAARPVAAPQMSEAAALTRSVALMRETEILPIVCRIAPAYLTHLSAQSVIANKDLLTAVVRGDFPDDFAHAQQVANRLAPAPTPLYTLALARFEWSPFADQIFIDRPNILTRHTFFSPIATGFKLLVATDIVANQIGVDPIVKDPFGVRLEQGVLDTNAEAVLASDRPSAANAGSAYTGSGRWTTLRSPVDPQLASLGLSGDVRKRIADDLAAGYVVVAPTSPVTVGSDVFSGWWRIDPTSGQALGMGGTGWGQAMVEYLVTIAWSAGLAFLFAYMWCQMVSGESPVARGCAPSPRDGGFALQDFLVAPVYAIGSACLHEALWAAALGGLMGAVGKWVGSKIGGGGSGEKADPFGDTQADPFAKTEPGASPAGGAPPGSGEGGKPGPLPWGSGAPGGTPPAGEPAPGPPPGGNPPPEYPPDVQKEIDAYKKWQQTTGPDKGKAFQEWLDAFRDSLRANPLIPDDLKKLISPPGTPWGTPVSPPAGTPPAGPTGPGGTQIIPPTGPGGTQIIPPPPASPTAPTQPAICPGPGCPPSPYEKTETGLAGVLNALGQKTGG